MIDAGVFKNEWAVLCERFDARPSQLFTKRYYEWLNARLTTEEFVHGAHRVFAEREFFPRPADFLPPEGEVKQRAAEQWERVTRLLRDFNSPLSALDGAAVRAVRQMGGLRNIGADAGQLNWRRKEFLELYAYAEPAAEPLPALTEAGRRLINDALAGRELDPGEAGTS